MAVDSPFPPIRQLMHEIGQAGRRLADVDASEGAAGNISVFFRWPLDQRREVEPEFPLSEAYPLEEAAPELAGGAILVTGSGRRLREVEGDPGANLGLVLFNEDGTAATLHTSPRRLFARLTSEFNSHLAVQRDQIGRNGSNFGALIHAQPLYLTYLSHVPRYQDSTFLNRHILRWEPECIVNLPEGVGHIPFLVPGSAELMAANVASLQEHRVVIWGKHGVMARSDASVKRACDRIEYAETGAKYEYLNLTNHGLADGLSIEEIRAICAAFDVQQSIF